MVDFNIVSAKLEALDQHVARIRKHAGETVEELRQDPDRADLVSFNLMLALQSCLDLAAHLIADQGWRPATRSAEAFDRLEAQGVLSAPTAKALARAVGMRNLIAHAYGTVDLEKIHHASHEGLTDLEKFAQELARWTTAR